MIEAPRRLAVFDLDGTITVADTYLAFLLFVLRRRPWRLFRCFALPVAVAGHALGLISNDSLKQRFLAAIAGGMRRSALDPLIERFAAHCRAKLVKPAAVARIAAHRACGDRLVLATASLDLYAGAIGRLLEFDAIVATKAAWRGERLSGGLEGPNLRGEAKLAAVLALADTPRPPLVAYTDHPSDLPLLLAADAAFVVDPAPRFHRIALALNLPVENWRA
jgi:HAD superfamily hydrolase (TIGR01490 family)